jgi:hypothetical protein
LWIFLCCWIPRSVSDDEGVHVPEKGKGRDLFKRTLSHDDFGKKSDLDFDNNVINVSLINENLYWNYNEFCEKLKFMGDFFNYYYFVDKERRNIEARQSC